MNYRAFFTLLVPLLLPMNFHELQSESRELWLNSSPLSGFGRVEGFMLLGFWGFRVSGFWGRETLGCKKFQNPKAQSVVLRLRLPR